MWWQVGEHQKSQAGWRAMLSRRVFNPDKQTMASAWGRILQYTALFPDQTSCQPLPVVLTAAQSPPAKTRQDPDWSCFYRGITRGQQGQHFPVWEAGRRLARQAGKSQAGKPLKKAFPLRGNSKQKSGSARAEREILVADSVKQNWQCGLDLCTQRTETNITTT